MFVQYHMTKSDLKEDLDFNDLSDMDDYSGLSPEEFLKALEGNFMDKGDIEAHHKLEELEKTLEEVDKAMTEPTKEVAEENIREDYIDMIFQQNQKRNSMPTTQKKSTVLQVDSG